MEFIMYSYAQPILNTVGAITFQLIINDFVLKGCKTKENMSSK